MKFLLTISSVLLSALFLLPCASRAAGAGQPSCADFLGTAGRLQTARQYRSAFLLLDACDPRNENPDAAVLKTDLALKYFAKTRMHKSFALLDLKPGEKLETFREQEGTPPLTDFDIQQVLETLVARYPENGMLYRALGDFFHDVYRRYGNAWFMESTILRDRAVRNYQEAYKRITLDAGALTNAGLLLLEKNKFKESEQYLGEALAQNKRNGIAHYNMGYLFYVKKNYQQAITYALQARELATDPADRFNAAYLSATIYLLMDDNRKAIAYFEIALREKTDYETLKSLLVLSLRDHNNASATAYAERMFALNPRDLAISQDILFIYGKLDLKKELLDFFKRQEKKYVDDPQVLGNICFNRAFFHAYFLNNNKAKVEDLIRAREQYNKIFPPDHEVFRIIESELQGAK